MTVHEGRRRELSFFILRTIPFVPRIHSMTLLSYGFALVCEVMTMATTLVTYDIIKLKIWLAMNDVFRKKKGISSSKVLNFIAKI